MHSQHIRIFYKEEFHRDFKNRHFRVTTCMTISLIFCENKNESRRVFSSFHLLSVENLENVTVR